MMFAYGNTAQSGFGLVVAFSGLRGGVLLVKRMVDGASERCCVLLAMKLASVQKL